MPDWVIVLIVLGVVVIAIPVLFGPVAWVVMACEVMLDSIFGGR